MTQLKFSKPGADLIRKWCQAYVRGHMNQKDIVFLHGNVPGQPGVQGQVTVSKKQSILFPIHNSVSHLGEPAHRHAEAKDETDKAKVKIAQVNGDPVPNDKIHRVGPVDVDFMVPVGGFDVGKVHLEPGKHQAACDGYWVLIEAGSLNDGVNSISFHGESSDGFSTSGTFTVHQV